MFPIAQFIQAATVGTSLIGSSCLASFAQEVNRQTSLSRNMYIELNVLDQRVDAFLDDLEHISQYSIQATDEVRGRVRSRSFDQPLSEILDEVAALLGLDWFSFGDVVFISAKSEASIRIVNVGSVSPRATLRALEESGLPMDLYPATEAADGNAIVLSGPPSFLALAEAVVDSLTASETVAAVPEEGRTVLVRRGIETELVAIKDDK